MGASAVERLREGALALAQAAVVAAPKPRDWRTIHTGHTAFYHTEYEEGFRTLREFRNFVDLVGSDAKFIQLYGAEAAVRVALQFICQYFDSLPRLEHSEAAASEVFERFVDEMSRDYWTLVAIANLRFFEAELRSYKFADGVTIAPRKLAELASRLAGTEEEITRHLDDDWREAIGGASQFVILCEHRVPKAPDNLVLMSSNPLIPLVRTLSAMRLHKHGDVSLGRVFYRRAASFNVGLGGVTSSGASRSSLGEVYSSRPTRLNRLKNSRHSC